MGKVEIDLKKLGSLQQEIKILESRKDEIERDANKIRNEAIKEKRRNEQELFKQREDFDIYKRSIEKVHKEVENNLTKRERDLQLREKEIRDLDQEMQRFNTRKRALSAAQKELDILKSNYLDREHKANLLIEQYNKKIGELPPEIKTEIGKAKKKK